MMILKSGVFAIALVAASPLNAQTVLDEPRQVYDLATVTCKQFLELPTNGLGIRLIYWLDGNYREDDEPPIIDTDKHKKMLIELADYCNKNPTHGLITASEKVFAKK